MLTACLALTFILDFTSAHCTYKFCTQPVQPLFPLRNSYFVSLYLFFCRPIYCLCHIDICVFVCLCIHLSLRQIPHSRSVTYCGNKIYFFLILILKRQQVTARRKKASSLVSSLQQECGPGSPRVKGCQRCCCCCRCCRWSRFSHLVCVFFGAVGGGLKELLPRAHQLVSSSL